MVLKKVETIVDDLDGVSQADETVPFGLDGHAMEIDLTAQHAAQFRTTMRKWVDAARRTGGRRSPKPSSIITDVAAVIRAWAKKNGHQMPARGRIPADIRAAYQKARR